MLRRISGVLTMLLLAATTSAASAQDTKPLSPFPAEGFQFGGMWQCSGAFSSSKVPRSTFAGASILGGKWLELTEQDVEPATGYLAKYLIGYDPRQGRLVEFDANNFGAATYSSQDGWQNRVLTMTSPVTQDAKALYVANRFMYSVLDQDSFAIDWQVSKSAALHWTTADHLACKRVVTG